MKLNFYQKHYDCCTALSIAEENDASIYKNIRSNYKDDFSNLHSDIIDHFGTFLTKKESIQFGYLNRQLYIETQKNSFLLKRQNDPTMSIYFSTINIKCLPKNTK